MAPTVVLECTQGKEVKRREIAFPMMGKSQKSRHSAGFVPDYRHAAETSEGLGSSGRVGSDYDDHSAAPMKRKCIRLNDDGFNVPLRVISLKSISASDRRELDTRFRSELEQIRGLQRRLNSRAVTSSSRASSLSGNGDAKKVDSKGQSGAQLKRGVTGRFDSVKPAARPTPLVSNSDVLLLKQCEQVLKRLMSHQYAWIFNTPVDVVGLKILDYYTVIKHPMDLGTIKTKIASGAYSSPRGFAADVRLTFTNAITYNPPGSDAHIMADVMSKFFESRWKPIEKKLAAVSTRVKGEPESAKALPKPAPKPVAQPNKSKVLPVKDVVAMPERAKPKMTSDEKQSLGRHVESLLADLPEHIVDFLRRHGDNANQTCEEEIEIDIDALSDDTLFELQRLLDDYLRVKKVGQQGKTEPGEMEIMRQSGLSNTSMHPFKGHEPADDDVDIGGNDPPISSYPPVEIEKDTCLRSSKCSSSSSSSSDSGSSSSDSDSSSGSDSNDGVLSPTKVAKGNVGRVPVVDQDKSDIMNPVGINRTISWSDRLAGSVGIDGSQEGENAASERQVSPEKLYRAALLRGRFADTILKAREKTLDQSDKADPEKLRVVREELERQQREEKACLKAEAKAAEEARRQAAAAEAKRKRELEREASRQALLKMEKTVEMNENSLILKDLEMLKNVPVDHVPCLVDETSPDQSHDGIGGFNFGGNPLEQLGLYMKVDDEEEEDTEPSNVPVNDVEDGEID